MKKLARTFNEHMLVHSSDFPHVCLRKTRRCGGAVSSGASSRRWKMWVCACIYMNKPQSWDIHQAFACPLARSRGCVCWILLVWRSCTRATSGSPKGTGAWLCVGALGTSECCFLHDPWELQVFDRLGSLIWPITSGVTFFSCVFFFLRKRVPFAILLSRLQDGGLKEGKVISRRISDSPEIPPAICILVF